MSLSCIYKLALTEIAQQYIDSVESFLFSLHTSILTLQPSGHSSFFTKYGSSSNNNNNSGRLDTAVINLLPQILVTSGIVLTTVFMMRKFFSKFSGMDEGEGGGGGGSGSGSGSGGGRGEDPERAEDVVHVKHGKTNYDFKFPLGAISSGSVTVGALRAKTAVESGVEASRVSLLGLGKSLKDDSATLRSLGMGSGTKILCMASTPTPKTTKQVPSPPPAAALTPLQRIEAVQQSVRDKTSALTKDFVANPPTDAKDREDAHRRISESIMAELLKLDGIESDDPAVRVRRKELVKELQRTLETVDAVLKQQGAGAGAGASANADVSPL